MKLAMHTNIYNLGYLLQSEKKKQVGIKHTQIQFVFLKTLYSEDNNVFVREFLNQFTLYKYIELYIPTY